MKHKRARLPSRILRLWLIVWNGVPNDPLFLNQAFKPALRGVPMALMAAGLFGLSLSVLVKVARTLFSLGEWSLFSHAYIVAISGFLFLLGMLLWALGLMFLRDTKVPAQTRFDAE